MPRVALDLNSAEDRNKVGGAPWRFAAGLVPGEPNEGLISQLEASPARLPDYDDSRWEICDNVRKSHSKGFTFGWWRTSVVIPEEANGVKLAGAQVFFETNIDNYGEIWIDGEIPPGGTVVGLNAQQRVQVAREAEPGRKYVIACFAANGPFGMPRGGIFLRYATLAFEIRDV